MIVIEGGEILSPRQNYGGRHAKKRDYPNKLESLQTLFEGILICHTHLMESQMEHSYNHFCV